MTYLNFRNKQRGKNDIIIIIIVRHYKFIFITAVEMNFKK